jgi:hypothetical protein
MTTPLAGSVIKTLENGLELCVLNNTESESAVVLLIKDCNWTFDLTPYGMYTMSNLAKLKMQDLRTSLKEHDREMYHGKHNSTFLVFYVPKDHFYTSLEMMLEVLLSYKKIFFFFTFLYSIYLKISFFPPLSWKQQGRVVSQFQFLLSNFIW